ncbi:MAG: pyridoxal phosphate-dependent aminotransferase [Roseovarius sp.]|nr:pyridoxal phosphate-dependent aminotransferase [Roseovarius sp.]
MHACPQYTDLALRLPATVPFVGPEAQERKRGRGFKARVGANENVFGPSPEAISAMRLNSAEIWKYADPEHHDLKSALAGHYGISTENIMVGEGIDGLLGYLCRLLVGEGTPVVTSLGAYPTFNYHVAGYGGTLHAVPYRDDAEDADALIAKVRETGASLCYFSNPDNPMGSWHSAEGVQDLIDSVPPRTVLCLDEAYIEFAPDDASPPLDVEKPNVIRMRTFSKAYGMAGARVGYAMGEAGLISAFNKIRNHFGMNRMALDGALAALADRNWLEHVKGEVALARDRIAEIARGNGLKPLPSATNFVAVDCGGDGDFAKRLMAELVSRDVFVRMPFVSPQDRCIRISAGRKDDLDLLEEVLPQALLSAISLSPLLE